MTVWGQTRIQKSEPEHKALPVRLELLHVLFTQNRLQCSVSGRILFRIFDKLMVELSQLSPLLQVIAEVSGLGVIGSRILMIKLVGGCRSQFLERRNFVNPEYESASREVASSSGPRFSRSLLGTVRTTRPGLR